LDLGYREGKKKGVRVNEEGRGKGRIEGGWEEEGGEG